MTCTVDSSTFDNQASFPISYLNTEVGCDMPDTIQLISNNPVWCNTQSGLKMLVSSLVQGEKNVIDLSLNINGDYERPGLLAEDNLKSAISFDSDGKYGIVLSSGTAYVWEYTRGYNLNSPKSMKWFKWDSIKASCFFIRDNTLMFGHSERGQLCKFINAYNDFGQPINNIFRTKLMDFSYPDFEKTISDLWATTRANSSSSMTVNLYDDNGEILRTIIIPQSTTRSFNWDDWDWDNFTWDTQRFSPTIRMKLNLKRVRYFQIEFSNNTFNESLNIISLIIKYALTRKVR
jgi:hypothetical protein